MNLPIIPRLSIGVGPSFALVNRTVEVLSAGVVDRLISFCGGGNTALLADISGGPTDDEGIHTFMMLKIRYLHAFSFDARGRNLDGYGQDFLPTSLALGVAYKF